MTRIRSCLRHLSIRAASATAVLAALLATQAVAQPAGAPPAAATPSPGAGTAAPDAAPLDPNADWPCVQHKQPTLTASQMWDGPVIAQEGERTSDPDVAKLVAIATTRRVPMEDVEKAIAEFAASLPEAKRDAKLAELFSAALADINAKRATVVEGIERFQRRQVARSRKLEQEGLELAELHRKAEADPALTSQLLEAQQRYDWDARVFQERQQNMPLACEIPVLMESRVFAIAQAVRANMIN